MIRLPTFVSFVSLMLALQLTGCAEFATGARTARDVLQGVCAVAGATADPAAELAQALRALTEEDARRAAAQGREDEARAYLQAAAGAMGVARAAAEEIRKLGGGAPAAPCVPPAAGPLPAAPAVLAPPVSP